MKNLDKLLAIPDEEFSKLTPEQRTNLVAQYAVVDYRHPAEVPLSITRRYDVTNNYELIRQKYNPRHHQTLPKDSPSTNAPSQTNMFVAPASK